MKRIKSLAELEQAIKSHADFYFVENRIERKVTLWEIQGMTLGAVLMKIDLQQFYYQNLF